MQFYPTYPLHHPLTPCTTQSHPAPPSAIQLHPAPLSTTSAMPKVTTCHPHLRNPPTPPPRVTNVLESC